MKARIEISHHPCRVRHILWNAKAPSSQFVEGAFYGYSITRAAVIYSKRDFLASMLEWTSISTVLPSAFNCFAFSSAGAPRSHPTSASTVARSSRLLAGRTLHRGGGLPRRRDVAEASLARAFRGQRRHRARRARTAPSFRCILCIICYVMHTD